MFPCAMLKSTSAEFVIQACASCSPITGWPFDHQSRSKSGTASSSSIGSSSQRLCHQCRKHNKFNKIARTGVDVISEDGEISETTSLTNRFQISQRTCHSDRR